MKEVIGYNELTNILNLLSQYPKSNNENYKDTKVTENKLISDEPENLINTKKKEINKEFSKLVESLKEFGLSQKVSFAFPNSSIGDPTLNSTSANETEAKFVVILTNIADIICKLNAKDITNEIENLINNLHSLEVYARLDYLKFSIINSTMVELKKTKEEAKEGIKREIKEINSKYQKVDYNIKKIQGNYIVILGIFASIILAFVSSLAFSTSVLNNIDKVSIYRLVAIVSLISIFIVNTLNFLFLFIKQIHYNKHDKYSKFNPVNCFNIVMLIIILLTAVAWYFGHPYEHKTTTNSTTTININASDLANCRAK